MTIDQLDQHPYFRRRGLQPPPRPGTALASMLRAVGFKECAACKIHASQMDAEGPAWCEANIETIVGWMRVEAARLGLAFHDSAARAMIRLAIKRSEVNHVAV